MRNARAISTWSPADSSSGNPRFASSITCSVQSSGTARVAPDTSPEESRAGREPCLAGRGRASRSPRRGRSRPRRTPQSPIASARSKEGSSRSPRSRWQESALRVEEGWRPRACLLGQMPARPPRKGGRRPDPELASVLVQRPQLGEAAVGCSKWYPRISSYSTARSRSWLTRSAHATKRSCRTARERLRIPL